MEVLIIGGIAAGASVAAKAKRTNRDANVTIIEKENYVSFGACGLPYYIGEQFDNPNQMFARSVEKTEASGINVLTGHQASTVDFEKKIVKVKRLDKEEVTDMKYDKLAICTGAKPNIFGEGSNADNVFTVTRLDEVERLKKRLDESQDVVVVGSGFIGIEVADQIRALGKNVRIIQLANRPMDTVFDPEFSELISMALEEEGIVTMSEHVYQGFVVEGNMAREVITDKGNFNCDMAILALGFKPNTGFLKDSPLEMLANGAIVADEFGKTNIEDVYALGDCATVYNPQIKNFYSPLATYANKMGRLVGENIVSEEQKSYLGAIGSASIKVGKYGLATTGLNEKRARDLGYDIETSFVTVKNHTSYYPDQSDISLKLVYDRESKVILGGQIFGKNGAVERMTAISVAVHKGLTTEELGFVDFSYSPPYAPTWDVLNVVGNVSK